MAFLFMIWRDITRSNHYRHELEKAKKRAEDLLDVRQRLMLTITHDIKAPVGSIIGYADLLDKTADGKKRAAYLGNMQTSAKHLLDLVNSLLDYHRLDADKMDINTAAFNPQQLLNAVADSYRPAAAAKGLRLEYDCDSALDGYFSGDPFRIRQIVENLMSNAMKFTKEGSVSMSAKLDNGRLSISVADTGCGMTEDEQKRIFQEFTRLKSAQGQEGFGLGLSITQKLVALLGGTMSVSSKPGEGSRFGVELPMPKADADTTSANERPAANARFSQPWSLLLIDDSIVRGTQLRETGEFLYASGAKEVHVRPACPPLFYGCKYLNFSRSRSDMDLITRRVMMELENQITPELLNRYTDPNTEEYQRMLDVICHKLNVTSLRYHRLDDMIESVGLPREQLCTYCWDGKED